MSEPRFRINAETTAAKVFDDEVVVINTVTGRYYDLEGTGALIWFMLDAGSTLAEIAASLSAAFGVPDASTRADAGRMLDQLVTEGLIVADGTGPAAADRSEFPQTIPHGPYEPPALTTYTDMEDLLAADPPLPLAPPPGTDRPA